MGWWPWAAPQQQSQQPTEQQQSPQQQQQQQQHTGRAPRMPSIYLRSDYTAACPAQHLAYLHCLQHASASGWLPVTGPWTCNEERNALEACRAAARAAAAAGDPLAGAREPSSTLLWREAQRQAAPVWQLVRSHWAERFQEWGAAVRGWGSAARSSGAPGAGEAGRRASSGGSSGQAGS
jgi:hypothetical protein